MKLRVIPQSLLLLALMVVSRPVSAQAPAESPVASQLVQEPHTVTAIDAESPSTKLAAISPEERLEAVWQALVAESKAGRIRAVNDRAFELAELSAKLGFTNLERFSTELLAFSQAALDSQDRESASFYLRKAVQLSPHSAGVLLEARRLAGEIGTFDGDGLLARAAWEALSQPQILVKAVISFIYPVLWAATLGLLVATGFCLAVSMVKLLRGGSTYLPSRIRGYLTAPLLLGALITPLFFGPLWCLVTWSCVATLMLSGRQWITFLSGVLLCLWGLLIPLREHGASWLTSHGVEAMLRGASGLYQPGDIDQLQFLTKEQPNNGVAWFALGQNLLQRGAYGDAREALLRAQRNLDDDHQTRVALGTLSFLTGNAQEADKIFAALHDEGFESAALYFNHSKAKFDLLDTAASRDLFDKANALEGETVKKLQLAEESLGFNHPGTTLSARLPLLTMLRASLHATGASEAQMREHVQALAVRSEPLEITAVGALLILIFLLVSGKRRVQRGAGYYTGYRHSPILFGMIRLIPSGSLALNGKPVRCALLCSLLALLVFPLLEWPSETKALISVVRGFELHYTFVFWFLIVACSYLGFYAYDEE